MFNPRWLLLIPVVLLGLYIGSLRGQVQDLSKDNEVLTVKLKEKQTALDTLHDKSKQLEADLGAAQKVALKVRTNTITKVETILKTVYPQECNAAVSLAYEQAQRAVKEIGK